MVTSSLPTTEQKLYTLSYFNLERAPHLCVKLIYGRKPWSALSADREHVLRSEQKRRRGEGFLSDGRVTVSTRSVCHLGSRRWLCSQATYRLRCPGPISKIQLAADQGKSTVNLTHDERAAVAMYAIGGFWRRSSSTVRFGRGRRTKFHRTRKIGIWQQAPEAATSLQFYAPHITDI